MQKSSKFQFVEQSRYATFGLSYPHLYYFQSLFRIKTKAIQLDGFCFYIVPLPTGFESCASMKFSFSSWFDREAPEKLRFSFSLAWRRQKQSGGLFLARSAKLTTSISFTSDRQSANISRHLREQAARHENNHFCLPTKVTFFNNIRSLRTGDISSI